MGEKTEILKAHEVEIQGKDVVVIQTKANRLGMNLLGQAVFSAELMKSYNPKSIRSVAICILGDSVLEPLANKFGIEVVIYESKSE